MNKYNRSKHKKMIKLMEEAAFATARLIQDGKVAEVPLILADCQDAAVALGTHIEKLYGMQTQTVAVLEEYCNALYQVSTDMNDASLIALAESIEQIQMTYDVEFPERREMVFMPYKSSMWDSMESIWRAASEDEECEVIVMPLPYYDLDPAGGFKALHWEGEDFLEEVEITSYKEYDITEHHPDVVIIHNPYDDGNKVTSIHPDYYSEKLRKHTETLVYVPYYVLPDAPAERHKHFVLQKGVLNADYVFVQNDNMRDFYIDLLKPYQDIGELEKKIIGIGSPKTDKAIYEQNKTDKIPVQWKNKLRGKKVLFFNTNVSLIINNTTHIIEYMQHIFEVLKKHTEFVVIWREHPLTLSTIEAMCPQLLDEYLQLRRAYVEDGYGILDETSEPHLAMAVSDCYYGAGGSLSAVYPVCGKPLLIMDYQYPKRISSQEISLEEMLKTASTRMLYPERNINTLDVFLSNISVFEAQKDEIIRKQSIRMDNLDGTVGEKIYQYIKRS